MRVGLMINAILWLLIIWCFSGCAQLIGIKSYKSGDTEIQFTTGVGMEASLNQFDTVDNRRAIQPGTGYRNGGK